MDDMESIEREGNMESEQVGSTRLPLTSANSNSNIVNTAATYGDIDGENEGNIHIAEAVSSDGSRTVTGDHSKTLATKRGSEDGLQQMEGNDIIPSQASRNNADSPDQERRLMPPPAKLPLGHKATSNANGIQTLPSELIDTILGYLSATDLSMVTQVCRRLHDHADADIIWQAQVLSNLPGNPIKTAYPFETFRELYVCHDPYWFIPKYKIWFCDRGLTGSMIAVQYDERRGVIEGYQLLAIRNRNWSEPWAADRSVHIQYFEPEVKLHRDRPVVKFSPFSLQKLVKPTKSSTTSTASGKPFFVEQPMLMNRDSDPRFSNIILAKPLSETLVQGTMSKQFPYDNVWPPPAIPARHRVAAQAPGISPTSNPSSTRESPSLWKPMNRAEASDQTFRVRHWMELGSTLGVHLGEEVVTYSTLDPKHYTPTAEKPWRGIWVGDYSAHGCEFLLIHQPDLDDEESKRPFVRNEGETDAEFDERFLRERVHKGPLEAIKLTGDPNVPRGECTFVAKDLGEAGFIGHAQAPPFHGARVVKSHGHIANAGFHDDRYMESHLMLVSHDRLAQFWVGFGHINFFERVDIDRLLVPQ